MLPHAFSLFSANVDNYTTQSYQNIVTTIIEQKKKKKKKKNEQNEQNERANERYEVDSERARWRVLTATESHCLVHQLARQLRVIYICDICCESRE
jgi:hypothetical protein